MEGIMDAMTAAHPSPESSGSVSLQSLGYEFVGLDDGWQLCGAGINGSFFDRTGKPIVDLDKFPDFEMMTAKAHSLNLRAGWYLNNCHCNVRGLEGEIIGKIMEQSVAALHTYGFDGVKLDSCSQFNNLTWWAELINATGKPTLIENCHQGGLAPDSRQWQTYIKNAPANYTHRLGYLGAGDDEEPPLRNASFNSCMQECDAKPTCHGFSFESEEAEAPSGLRCYLKDVGASFIPYDTSNSKCDGGADTCPYNFYRTSGDINARWKSMLGNLNSVVRWLGSSDGSSPPLSVPGAWAYPDMLEVGRLENVTEDRTHFGAWAVISSPLILGFDLRDQAKFDRVWPVISNSEVIAVNQAWAGSPGRRIFIRGDSQAWSKPLGRGAHALFVFSNHTTPLTISVDLGAISPDLNASGVTVNARDLYTHSELGVVAGPAFDAPDVAPHDSRFIVLTASKASAPETPVVAS